MTDDESQGPSGEEWIPDPGSMVAYATDAARHARAEGAADRSLSAAQKDREASIKRRDDLIVNRAKEIDAVISRYAEPIKVADRNVFEAGRRFSEAITAELSLPKCGGGK